MIHPTAVIHPKAQLGADCEIGPYCVIGEHVSIGSRNCLHSHVVVGGHTTIGDGNEIFPFSTVGLKTQDLKWVGGITWTQIGNNNNIREGVTIHSATGDGETTVIGSHNHILAGSHLGHNVMLGDRIIVSKAGLAGHVLVEDHAVIGGMSAVHQFCRIGRMAIIGGCSKVVQDVPPFMMVDGNPGETRAINKIGMERNGVSEEAQIALRQAFKILFREGLTVSNALIRIESELPKLPEIEHLVKFVRTSERGISK